LITVSDIQVESSGVYVSGTNLSSPFVKKFDLSENLLWETVFSSFFGRRGGHSSFISKQGEGSFSDRLDQNWLHKGFPDDNIGLNLRFFEQKL